jgi:neural Wiskott-Aldrich syndrome protein
MSQFATALSWVPMSRNLAATMVRACDYAGQQAHRHVTLEHLLLALTDDSDASAVLSVSNVDLGQLGADVAAYVNRNDNRFQPDEVIDPAADETLVRILDYAAAAARQSRRREINGAVVLAAVIGDGNSTAATILKAQGLTFEAAIKALQRSGAQPKAAAVPDPDPVPVASPEAQTAGAVPAEEQSVSGSASLANEAMLANVRRKLEATRAAAPARLPIAPIANLTPPPVPSPPKLRPVTLPSAGTETSDLVDESAGLATLAKHSSTAPVATAPVALAGFPMAQTGSVFGPLAIDLPVAVPSEKAPPPAPEVFSMAKSAGADLAKTHNGWLPPASPTLVTEAARPARRPPPVPVAERKPGPETGPVAVSASDWHPRDPNRISQDAGPPRAPRSPSPAPWPETPPSLPSAPTPLQHRGSYQNAPPSAHQTSLSEFQPTPRGVDSNPDGGLYQPNGPQSYPVQARSHNQAPPGQNSSGAGSAGQRPPVPPQSPAAAPFHTPPHGLPPPGQIAQHPPGAHRPPQQTQTGANPATGGLPQQRAATAAAATASVSKLTGPIPTSWRVSQSQPVEIGLSPEELRALALQLDGRGAAYAHEKIVAKALSVRLKTSDNHFTIQPTSPETLWLDAQTLQMSNDGARWRWHVTPQAGGKARLQLVISARTVGADGVVAETAIPDQSIAVKISGNRRRLALKLLRYLAILLLGAVLARYGEGGIETMLAWKRGFQ